MTDSFNRALSERHATIVRTVLHRDGEAWACRLFGVPRTTILRAALGLPIRAASRSSIEAVILKTENAGEVAA